MMAKIGTFIRSTDNVLTGRIATLTFSADLTIKPVAGHISDSAPSHRIITGGVDVGLAWTKQQFEGRIYYLIKIDDPSFSSPISATLIESDGVNEFALIWDRPGSHGIKPQPNNKYAPVIQGVFSSITHGP